LVADLFDECDKNSTSLHSFLLHYLLKTRFNIDIQTFQVHGMLNF